MRNRERWIVLAALVASGTAIGQTKLELTSTGLQLTSVGGGIEGFSNQVVPDKPFSATEERHSLQVLGDGTRIEGTETSRLYRDGEGRTRIERTSGNVTIFDPVAGYTAELNPSFKSVVKTYLPGAEVRELNTNRIAALKDKIESERRMIESNPRSPDGPRLRDEISQNERTLAELETRIQAAFSPVTVPLGASADGTGTYIVRPGGGLLPILRAVPTYIPRDTNARTKVFYFSADHQAANAQVTSIEAGNNWSLENLPAQTINEWLHRERAPPKPFPPARSATTVPSPS